MTTRGGEDVAAKFTAAWEVFSRTCGNARAPEATYQAWFAHYLISQFGIDRVAREPTFRHWKMFAPSPFLARFKGQEIKLDVVVTRRPGIDMPHWVHRSGSKHGGTALLGDQRVEGRVDPGRRARLDGGVPGRLEAVDAPRRGRPSRHRRAARVCVHPGQRQAPVP